MCLQERVCVLLITHPVTNLLSEPVARHSAVVLINRPGHCARAGPCSLVYVSVCVFFLCVAFCDVMSAPHLSLIEAGFIITFWSHSLNPKHP